MESNHNTPSLFDVVKSYDLIKIDDYQRTYAWTKDEIDELFTDLVDSVDSNEFHFFGTLIFQSESNALGTIVDGQQRLTTIFVLMAALRDEIESIGIDTLPRSESRPLPIPVVNKTWEFLYHNLNPQSPRFKSNRFIEETLLKSVYASKSEQEPLRERDNYLTLAFRKAVKELRTLVHAEIEKVEGQEQKLSRVNEFIDAVRDRFLVLRVTTSSLAESLEIFLTLNNRGLPLGPSDLVRGEIIANVSRGENETEQARIHGRIFEEWSDIADNVDDAEAFLRHYLVASGKSKVQKKKVYKTVIDRLRSDSPAESKKVAKDFWEKLKEASYVYNQIINPTMGGNTEYYLHILHDLMKSHRVLMLTVLTANLSPDSLAAISRQIYVLCIRWNMDGGNAQQLEDLFQKLGNDFKETLNVESLITSLKSAAKELREEAAHLYLRSSADEGFVGKAILHAINRARAHGANEVELTNKIHLEHIAPQSSTEAWKIELFSGDVNLYPLYDSTIKEIGNLTLLDFKLNMSIKQGLLSEKKIKYDISTIKLTDDLCEVNRWDALQISRRTDYLIEAFDSVFSIEPTGFEIVPYTSWLDKQIY